MHQLDPQPELLLFQANPAGAELRFDFVFLISPNARVAFAQRQLALSKRRPDLPMAHLLPHWNWPERVGEITPVHVYTSGDEGDATSHVYFQAKECKAYNGLALVIVRMKKVAAGAITLQARSEGLAAAEIRLRSK